MALYFFFTHCQSPETGLMAWGEHLYWDFNTEGMAGNDLKHEICGEWPFWEHCYKLAPEACWRFAIGQWDHQIADKETGDFSRHARWSKHGPQKGSDFPRYAGQMIVNWADAYDREENSDRDRREEMITAILCLVRRMEENMEETRTGYLPARKGADYVWTKSNLELARCLWQAAEHVPEKLAKRLRQLALRQDDNFLKAPHKMAKGKGFASTLHAVTGQPRSHTTNKPYTTMWATGYGYETHADMANECYARLQQVETSHPYMAQSYRALILAAADQYLTTTPDTRQILKPEAFASLIILLVNASEISGERKYLDRADYFGRLGMALFLGDGLPLPKATNKHEHYETITGGPDFMYALLRLQEALND